MAITYPTTIDSLTNPSSTDTLDSPSHSDQHADINDAVEALEAKVGVDSSAVATSVDYKLTNTSSSNPGHKHTLANGATDVTSSAGELNKLDGTDATKTDFDKLHDVTSSAAELNLLDGVTATTAELNKTDGVAGDIVGTTDIQTLTNKTLTNPVINYTDTMLAKNVLVRAYLNTEQTNLVHDTDTLVELETESYDLGGDFNTTTHLFTAPITGYYRITGQVYFNQVTANQRYIMKLKEGVTIVYISLSHSAETSDFCINGTTTLYLTAEDTIGLYAQSESGGNLVDVSNGESNTFLEVELISI